MRKDKFAPAGFQCLSNLKTLVKDEFEMVALIKPQFETEQKNIGKNGIVKDKKVHFKIINGIIEYCNNIGLFVNGLTYSPIKGSKGNIEYLIYLSEYNNNKTIDIQETINSAHKSL